jgi:membrane protein DedA with SNARE-associated domain
MDLSVNEIIQFLARHGYLVIFVWVLVEQLGLPIPAAPMLLAAGTLAGAGKLNFIGVLVVGVAGSMVSDVFWYQIGRRRGASVLSLICRISLMPDACVSRMKEIFGRHGSHSLLMAKFIPGLNAVSTPMAGTAQMSLLRFLLFDGLGALNWVGGFAGLGYVFSSQIERVAAYARTLGNWFGVLLALALAVYVVWKYRRRRRFLVSEDRSRTQIDI